MPVLLIIVVTVLFHLVFLPVGLDLLNSEWAIFSFAANDFRAGKWMAYPYGQEYGGMTLTAVRGLWCAIWEFFDHSAQAYLRSQFTFSYGFVPVLMALSAYLVVRAYCSKGAALIVGLLTAVGFHYTIIHYGNDFYQFYFALGCLLLAMRAGYENPFIEFSKPKLFIAALIAGQAYYTSPATAVFIVALFLPVKWAWAELKKVFALKGRFNRVVLKVCIVLLCLFAYIEFYGRELGPIGGKMVKLDSQPNFDIAFVLLALLWFKENRKWLTKKHFERAALVGLGFFVGFLPHILFLIQHRVLSTNFVAATYDLKTSLMVLGKVPDAIRKFVTGSDETNLGFIQNLPIILISISIIVFLKTLKKQKKLEPIVVSAALALLVYIRMRSNVLPWGPHRYLFPIFPAFLVMYGNFWDTFSKRKWGVALALALFVTSAAHQLIMRQKLITNLEQTHAADQVRQAVSIFQKANVDVVLTDDFWHSNVYSFVSRRKPWFVSNGRPWLPFEAEKAAAAAHRAGIYLKNDEKLKAQPETIEILGRNWRLKKLGQAGDHSAYLGENF